MELNPYLNFNGNCAEAVKFYEKVLGAKVLMSMTFGQTPMKDQMPPESHDMIVHVRMQVGKSILMASDSPGEYYKTPAGFTVSMLVDSPEEAESIFAALSDGGEVRMAMEETFWAKRFGMCVDKFGTPWMVNCEKPMP